MAEIINLRLARKRKARDVAADAAAQARAMHGLSKAEKTLARARAEKAEREVEAHRLSGPEAGLMNGPATGPDLGLSPDRATAPASEPGAPQPPDPAVTKPV